MAGALAAGVAGDSAFRFRGRWRGGGMAFKLIESAQARWRAVKAPHLVALVRAGAKFENGKLIERPESDDESQTA